MGPEAKEAAKRAFGFSAVPFYVVAGPSGGVRLAGGPKVGTLDAIAHVLAEEDAPAAGTTTEMPIDVTVEAAAEAVAEVAAEAAPAPPVFTLDEDF